MLPIRQSVRQTPAYVPGEQPQTNDFVKLNTNENPYPPPARIFQAVSSELEKVRLYPDPVSTQLRKAAALPAPLRNVSLVPWNARSLSQ